MECSVGRYCGGAVAPGMRDLRWLIRGRRSTVCTAFRQSPCKHKCATTDDGLDPIGMIASEPELQMRCDEERQRKPGKEPDHMHRRRATSLASCRKALRRSTQASHNVCVI